MDEQMTADERRGAGGTSGGVPTFLLGVGMASAGAYLLTSRVMVHTGGWRIWGYSGFGLSLIPLLLGIGMLFFDGRSLLGKLLTFIGLVIIFAAIISNMDIYFAQTTLFATLMMLALLAGGIGLVLRSLRPQ